MIDQRRYQRTRALPGDINHPRFTGENISETGMKLRVPEQQTVGSTFSLTLTLLEEPIDVLCQVVWCKKSSVLYDETFFIGVEFVDFSVLAQLKIRDVVNERIEKEEQALNGQSLPDN